MLLGYFAAIGAALLGGLLPSVSKPLLELVNPLLFTAIVTFAPAITFTPVSIRSKENKHIRRQGYAILAASAVASGLVAPYIYFVGLEQSTASDAALLANGEMVFTVLIATLFFGERLSRRGFFALFLLGIGIVAVITDLNFSSSLIPFLPAHLSDSDAWSSARMLTTKRSDLTSRSCTPDVLAMHTRKRGGSIEREA